MNSKPKPVNRLPKGELRRLTDREQRALDFIAHYLNQEGLAPSFREIGMHMGNSTPSTGAYFVRKLLAKGRIEKTAIVSRGIRIVGNCPTCGRPLRRSQKGSCA